jgi:hypothetical protein
MRRLARGGTSALRVADMDALYREAARLVLEWAPEEPEPAGSYLRVKK